MKNFKELAKSLNGKIYRILLKDLQNLEETTLDILGILIKTNNLRKNMYGNSFDYNGRFLTDNTFNLQGTSQALIDGDFKYSLELEYDFVELGKNNQINNFRHRSFLIKPIN
ncbi:hypothetical protein ABSA28_00544 [Candidatus Hepatincolaceae symbiont of Richtersius coronifer]